jgi:hypothetical protein
VVLEIRDSAGRLVRRFASTDTPAPSSAELYFAKAWTRPAATLPGSPGMHRFLWNLHYTPPKVVRGEYSSAAVWGQGTPTTPQGAFATPGRYTVALTVDGRTVTAPLDVTEDPRVTASAADLKAELDLSLKLSAALERDRQGYGEMQSVQTGLAALIAAKDLRAGLRVQAQAVVDVLSAKAPPGELTFDSSGGLLGRIEGDLEGADATPTTVQTEVAIETLAKLDKAWLRWTAVKTGPLAALNTALGKAGRKPIWPPSPDRLDVTAPDPGQDLP